MNKLYQVSTLNALMLGNFQGVTTVDELLAKGSYGIGTFEGLDGELIALDGKVYNGKGNGNVQEYGKDEKSAFAVMYNISDNAKNYSFQNISNFEHLKENFNRIINEDYKNKNVFYVLKAEVTLNSIKVRSFYKQEKPYKTLPQLVSSQTEYTYENCKGYLVGVWCPKYVEGLNMPEWHLHFLSEDKTKGGHMLEVDIKEAKITIEDKTNFEMMLPTNEEFKSINLNSDLRKDTEKVEG